MMKHEFDHLRIHAILQILSSHIQPKTTQKTPDSRKMKPTFSLTNWDQPMSIIIPQSQ